MTHEIHLSSIPNIFSGPLSSSARAACFSLAKFMAIPCGGGLKDDLGGDTSSKPACSFFLALPAAPPVDMKMPVWGRSNVVDE